ncbi:nucleolin-like [Palaemon carinicauda]|uniref:nucleolin-like n=1 Tax=Palaemon carinicauda TaxID=392227 RepID=UPI0035B63DBF
MEDKTVEETVSLTIPSHCWDSGNEDDCSDAVVLCIAPCYGSDSDDTDDDDDDDDNDHSNAAGHDSGIAVCRPREGELADVEPSTVIIRKNEEGDNDDGGESEEYDLYDGYEFGDTDDDEDYEDDDDRSPRESGAPVMRQREGMDLQPSEIRPSKLIPHQRKTHRYEDSDDSGDDSSDGEEPPEDKNDVKEFLEKAKEDFEEKWKSPTKAGCD